MPDVDETNTVHIIKTEIARDSSWEIIEEINETTGNSAAEFHAVKTENDLDTDNTVSSSNTCASDSLEYLDTVTSEIDASCDLSKAQNSVENHVLNSKQFENELTNSNDSKSVVTSKSGRPLKKPNRYSIEISYKEVSENTSDEDEASHCAINRIKKNSPVKVALNITKPDVFRESKQYNSRKRKHKTIDEQDDKNDADLYETGQDIHDSKAFCDDKKYRAKAKKKKSFEENTCITDGENWTNIDLKDHIDKYAIETYKSTHRTHRGHDVEETLFKCLVCGEFKASEEEYFRKHIEEHVNGCLRCGICSFEAQSKGFRAIHMRQVHRENMNFICDICGFTTVSDSSSMRNHMGNVHGILGFQCVLCPAKFKTKASRRKHYVTDHTKEKRYCKNCCRFHASFTEEQYEQHLATCPATIVCDECGATLANRENGLEQHKKSAHTNIRNYPCSVCPFTGKNCLALKRHMKVHDGRYM